MSGATGEPVDLAAVVGVGIDPELATMALTHRSYAYENGGVPNNERLEFLGDAVLELAVTEFLYREYPDRPEGDLAKIRASLVNTHVLADIARELGPGGLGAHLRLGRGEEMTGGRDKHSILADATEAVFGAIYLQHGLETAREVVLRVIGERLHRMPGLGAALDWKTSLQEKSARLGLAKPGYVLTSTGPDHDKVFTAVAVLEGRELGSGTGRTKKEAEQRAAELAWKSLDAVAGAGPITPAG